MSSRFEIVHSRWAMVILLVLNLVAIGVAALGLKKRYDWATHDAEVRIQNVALAIDLHLSNEVSKIDLSLNTVVAELRHHLRGEEKAQRQTIDALLKRQKTLLPEAEGWGITDAAGRIVFNESDEDLFPISVANRDYFLDLQSGRVDGLILSKPLKSQRTGNTVVVFARPYWGPGRAFSGVVLVPLPVSYFDQVLAGFDLGPRGVAVVRDADSGLITRVVSGKKSSAVSIGDARLSKELQSIVAAGKTQATYHSVTPIDEVERIYSYRKLNNAPFHVLAGVSNDDFLKDWRAAVWGFAGFLGLFLFIVNGSAALLYRQWRQQQRDAASLLRSNERLTQSLKDLSERDNALAAAQEAGKLGTYTLHIPSGNWTCHAQLDALFGIDSAYPHTIEGWTQLIHPDDRIWMTEYFFVEVIGKCQFFDREYRVIRYSDGNVIWVNGLGKLEIHDDGQPVSMSGTIQDISVRRFAEERMRLSQEVCQNAISGIIVTDCDGTILETNPAFERITGYSSEEAKGQDVQILRSDAYDEEVYKRLREHLFEKGYWEGEITGRRKDGGLYFLHSRISAIRNHKADVVRFAAVISDVTELRESKQRLEYLAYYDELTQLPNRTLLSDRMRQAMAACRRMGNRRIGICCLDLDGFNKINDRWGHEIGDQLLIEVSKRLQSCVRANDTVARLGGDEFVIIFGDLDDEQGAKESVLRLLRAAGKPYQIGAVNERVTFSAGLTLYPSDTTDEADVLIRQADQAMYEAKRSGKNCMSFFDLESELRFREHQRQYDRLVDALERGEFRLFYQPKVELRSGHVIGVEALMRWQHPERGLLPPNEFIPIIEVSALTLSVGEWIIHEALRQRRKWLEQRIDINVSINVFGLHLQRSDFVERLGAILREYPEISPHAVEFEVVETTALDNLEGINERILGCKELGVSFSLDDFGTGYSSLTYLRELPVDTVKIDRSFVSDMLFNDEDRALVESIVGMAHTLGRKVVAEGVETIEHGVQLIRCGCDLGQGYGIARPMPSEDLQRWIERWSMPKTWSDAISNDPIYSGSHS